MSARERAPRKLVTDCVSWRWNGNLGDDLIYAAQERIFRDDLELAQYPANPDAVLVGGGTFVPKAPEHPQLVELSRRLPTAFFGTGIGDPLFWGRDHIPTWLEIVDNARFVGVRGPLSHERLVEWGVPEERVDWIGDAGLFFAGETAVRHQPGALGVNLGITYRTLYGFDEAALERALAVALRELARRGWEITLLCAWHPDAEALERLSDDVPIRSVEHWHDDYELALASVGRFDVVVSEKLHVGVVAACRHVPFVALNYRSKVLDFCRSIGWADLCLEIEALDPERIVDSVESLSRERAAQVSRLRLNVERARRRLLAAAPRAVEALSPTGRQTR